MVHYMGEAFPILPDYPVSILAHYRYPVEDGGLTGTNHSPQPASVEFLGEFYVYVFNHME